MAVYDEVVASNIRAYRSRTGIGQERLAARMRALGQTSWLRQTVSKAERGDRRITSEEVLCLAYALEVTVRRLLSPQSDDKTVEFPNGASVGVLSVQRMLSGSNDGAITWNGDVPVFGDVPPAGHMSEPGPEDD